MADKWDITPIQQLSVIHYTFVPILLSTQVSQLVQMSGVTLRNLIRCSTTKHLI